MNQPLQRLALVSENGLRVADAADRSGEPVSVNAATEELVVPREALAQLILEEALQQIDAAEAKALEALAAILNRRY